MAETNSLRYKRILLKLSGESLMGDKSYGIDEARLTSTPREIIVASAGAEVAVVIGGATSIAACRPWPSASTGCRATTWACWPP